MALLKTSNERKEVLKLLQDNEKIVDKLRKICYNTIRESEFPSEVDYDSPNWSEKLADTIGYRRAFKELYDLLSLTEGEQKGSHNRG